MLTKIDWPQINGMLRNVKNNLYLIMPSIHVEWIEALKSNPNIGNLNVNVCIDNSAGVIRNGYGSIESIDSLLSLRARITECPGLRISFISADEDSYLLFLESRIIAGEPDGTLNAIYVTNEMRSTILNNFFGINDIDEISHPFNFDSHEKNKEQIELIPIVKPDLTRQINTYKTHFQYAEIHFEGGGIQSKTITIPKDALPFKDAELKYRMKTRFNLFTKEDAKKWYNLDQIESLMREIRKEFLHPCKYKRGRSIIEKSKKKIFIERAQLIKNIVETKKQELTDNIQRAINKAEDVLFKELKDFFENNPPDLIKNYIEVDIRDRQVDKMIQEIIFRTKIPTAGDLISKMSITTEFAEFTVEDLSDNNFIEWFKEKKLLSREAENEIASFSPAFGIK